MHSNFLKPGALWRKEKGSHGHTNGATQMAGMQIVRFRICFLKGHHRPVEVVRAAVRVVGAAEEGREGSWQCDPSSDLGGGGRGVDLD